MATFNGSGIDGNKVLIDPTGLSVVSTTSAQEAISELDSAAAAAEDLSTTLGAGNSTGGNDVVVSAGDEVHGQDGSSSSGSDLRLRGGDGQGGSFDGGDVIITPGAGSGGGASGVAVVSGNLRVSGDFRQDGNLQLRGTAPGVLAGADIAPVITILNPNAGVNSQVVYFSAKVVAYAEPPGAPPAPDDTACWTIEGVVVRDQSTDTVAFPSAPVITPLHNANPMDWDVVAVADDPTKSLKLTVTVDGFGAGPGVAPPASFFAQIELVPAGPL